MAGRSVQVPDSEDEPFTSSPLVALSGSDGAVSQLDGTKDESRAGSSPIRPEEGDAHNITSSDDPSASHGHPQSLETVPRANPQSDALLQSSNELETTHQHVASVADTCDFSKQHSSVPTHPSSLQPLNKQIHSPERAQSKGPMPEVKEQICESAIETAKATPESGCAPHRSPTTDSKLWDHNGQPARSCIEAGIGIASSQITPTLIKPEGSLPATELTQQTVRGETGLLHSQVGLHLQQDRVEKSPTGRHAAENGHINQLDSSATECRGYSCPPSISPNDASIHTHQRAPKRSTTTDRALIVPKRSRYTDRKATESSDPPSTSKETDSMQATIQSAKNSSISMHPDITTDSFEPSMVNQSFSRSQSQPQQKEAESSFDDTARFSRSDMDPGTASSLDSVFQSGARSEIIHPRTVESTREEMITESTPRSAEQTSSSEAPITEGMLLAPVKSAQEVTLAELKAKRAALIASLASLPTIKDSVIDATGVDPNYQLSNIVPSDSEVMAAAHKLNKRHIKLLHEYNEIKDVGQGLMGLIADQRGVRIVEVQDDFGIDAKD